MLSVHDLFAQLEIWDDVLNSWDTGKKGNHYRARLSLEAC